MPPTESCADRTCSAQAAAAPSREDAEDLPPQPSILQRLAKLAIDAVTAVDDLLDRAMAPLTDPGRAIRPSPPTAGSPIADFEGRLADRDPFLIPGEPSQLPGRWCTGTIPLVFDVTQAAAAGLDAAVERRLWVHAAAAWTAASGGAYRLTDAGDASIGAGDGSAVVDVADVPPFAIAITYGGAPGTVAASHAADVLQGATAGYGGLTVLAGGGTEQDGRAESGYVIIDAPDIATSLPTEQRRLQLYIHELGHALGLAHTEDEESIMIPEIAVESRSIGAPDREALRTLADLPCVA